MLSVCGKELRQFFGSLTGYIAIGVFLLLNGLLLFVVPSNNVLDYNILESGYASLTPFFNLAPWVLMLLIPAITMRSFAEEFRSGTYEILQTRPLTRWQILFGKYLGALAIVGLCLLPTLIYILVIKALSGSAGIDGGSIAGSYFGLFFLAAVFTAIGVCCSSFTNNAVAAFLVGVVVCLAVYFLFTAISRLEVFSGNADYYLAMFGLDFHYSSMGRGVIDTRDLVYFASVTGLFLIIAYKNLGKR
jgi:ABC-2 type transport system permease protein